MAIDKGANIDDLVNEANKILDSSSGGEPNIIALIIVVVFGLAMLFTAYKLLMNGQEQWSVVRPLGIISIIVFSVLLILIGYSKDQITGVIGLFGTIAGYLLGKTEDKKN